MIKRFLLVQSLEKCEFKYWNQITDDWVGFFDSEKEAKAYLETLETFNSDSYHSNFYEIIDLEKIQKELDEENKENLSMLKEHDEELYNQYLQSQMVS